MIMTLFNNVIMFSNIYWVFIFALNKTIYAPRKFEKKS